MDTRFPRRRTAGVAAVVVAAVAGLVVAGGAAGGGPTEAAARARDRRRRTARRRRVIALKDARLKFEINATDGDGGVQVFIDADPWREMSIFDPAAGGCSARPRAAGWAARAARSSSWRARSRPSASCRSARLLERFPQGRYTFRGVGLAGERYAGPRA